MTSERIIMVPLPGIGTLELPADLYDRHLRPIASPATAATPAADDRLLTAEEMQDRTSIPASWWETAARESRVRCYRFGKYTRFRLEEAAADAREARR